MLVQTAAPSTEPVTLAEARVHLRLTADDSTAEDGLITRLIADARRRAESLTGRSFVTQSWRLVLDAFPHCIVLERGDVQQIDSLTYRDTAGVTQTVTWGAASNSVQRSTDGTLVADLTGGTARIMPAFGNVWPIAIPEIGAIAVTYTAGYGAAPAVPEGIKDWILLRVASLYANREEAAAGIVSPMPWLDGMLDPYTVVLA